MIRRLTQCHEVTGKLRECCSQSELEILYVLASKVSLECFPAFFKASLVSEEEARARAATPAGKHTKVGCVGESGRC